MGMQEAVREIERERRQEKAVKVAAAEARRNRKDHSYARRVDAIIGRAERIATEAVGDPPRRSEVARRVAWDQAWSRAYHRAMDLLTNAKGLRTQSWQVKT